MGYYADLIKAKQKPEALQITGTGYYAELLKEKYNYDKKQPRDEKGRWVDEGGASGTKAETTPNKYTDNTNFEKDTKRMLKDVREHKGLDRVQEISYRTVDKKEAQKIQKDTGLNLEGYVHNISNTDIWHIFDNHGKEKEKLRGQEPITDEDILKIPEITKNYDKLSIDGEKSEDRYVIKYEKQMGNTYYYFESVGGKKNKTLRPKTFYKTKNKKGQHTD